MTEIREPKSRSSIRTIELPESIMVELEEHRKHHRDEMMKKGYRTDFVFTTNTGHFIDKQDFRRAWKRHLKRADVSYKKFHACRATYCTILCKNGVPLETASKLMGHSDINVTASFYRMVSSSERKQAVSRINYLFEG